MKKIIKIIAFLLIFIILFTNIFSVLRLEKDSLYYFFKEDKNTMDVLYVGASNVYIYFNNTLAYSEYGFTTGLLSTYGIPFSGYYYLIKESRNYQTPELYIIDLANIAISYTYDEAGVRRVTDSMSNSLNRIEAINYLLKESGIEDNVLSYYFSFIKYHDRWKDITYTDFNNAIFFKGYSFTDWYLRKEEQNKTEWIYDTTSLGDSEEVLIKLLDYLKEEELNTIFVIPIKSYDNNEMKRLNRAVTIIDEYGYEVINFTFLDDEIGIDYANDFYNEYHLNVYGATKYTLYFSKYLVENYDLPDHRWDDDYSSWTDEYERFKQSYFLLTDDNFEELVEAYYEKDY